MPPFTCLFSVLNFSSCPSCSCRTCLRLSRNLFVCPVSSWAIWVLSLWSSLCREMFSLSRIARDLSNACLSTPVSRMDISTRSFSSFNYNSFISHTNSIMGSCNPSGFHQDVHTIAVVKLDYNSSRNPRSTSLPYHRSTIVRHRSTIDLRCTFFFDLAARRSIYGRSIR